MEKIALVKKLLNKRLNYFNAEFKVEKLSLRIKNRISEKRGDISFIYSTYNENRDIESLSHSLNLNLIGVKNRAKTGYTNCYYKGRKEKLDSFILHNRKMARDFILCHELSHAYLIRKEFKLNKIRNIFNKEKNADRLAIALLRKNNLLKRSIKSEV